MKTSTLRPGLLVALSTSQRGNVTYDKRVTEAERVAEDGSKKAAWETKRTIADPAEHDRASEARMLARRTISKVCTTSAFGLLCPEDKKDELDEAIAEARKTMAEFNATAKIERIRVDVLVGRIADNDVDAVKAINGEIEEMLRQMQEGLRNLDTKMVREAANRARQFGQMLSPDAQARVQIAIDTARKVATEIKAAGEQAAVQVDLAAIRRIDEQRLAFLDLDGEREVVAIQVRGRAVDLGPAPAGVDAARQSVVEQRQLEM